MKTELLILGLMSILYPCDKKHTDDKRQSDVVERKDSIKTDSVDNLTQDVANCDLVAPKDFLSPTGDFVRYTKNNGRVKIEWGNKQFKRSLKDDFDCGQPPTGIPSVRWTTSSYIGLGYGCGSPCWGLIILPMNPTDSTFKKMYDFDVDTKNNQVVYLDNKKYNQLTVENWKTGRKTEIKIKVQCDSAFPGYCIDSVKIQNGELYVRWKELIRDKEEGKVTSETIKVGQ